MWLLAFFFPFRDFLFQIIQSPLHLRMFKVNGDLATCPGFTYSPSHCRTDYLFHNSSWETVAITIHDRGDRWVKKRGWLRSNHFEPPSPNWHPWNRWLPLRFMFLFGYCCKEIKGYLYSWKPLSFFFPPQQAPVHSFVMSRSHIPWGLFYIRNGPLSCSRIVLFTHHHCQTDTLAHPHNFR